MSLRSALSSLAPARRLFSSARVARAAAPDSAAAADAFADLARITGAPSAPTASSSSFASPTPTSNIAPGGTRGYPPNAAPPKVDPILDLFTNLIMKGGRKAEAQKHVANILEMLQRATNTPPLDLLRRAVEMSAPSVRVISTRKSAKTIQVPRALNERQRARTGIMWLLKAAERGRNSAIRRDDRIAREILAVLEGTSDVSKRIEELHRSAMMNRSNLNAR